MHNVLPFPAPVALVPLRAFHIEHGEGRTVAMLFRVAVRDLGHEDHDRDQHGGNAHTDGAIGADK